MNLATFDGLIYQYTGISAQFPDEFEEMRKLAKAVAQTALDDSAPDAAELVEAEKDIIDARRWRVIHSTLPDDELEELAITVATDTGISPRALHKKSAVEISDAAIDEQGRRSSPKPEVSDGPPA